MNGLEVQERLASSGNPLPVIFITAHDDLGSAIERWRQAQSLSCAKPFNDELFIKDATRGAQLSPLGKGPGAMQIQMK